MAPLAGPWDAALVWLAPRRILTAEGAADFSLAAPPSALWSSVVREPFGGAIVVVSLRRRLSWCLSCELSVQKPLRGRWWRQNNLEIALSVMPRAVRWWGRELGPVPGRARRSSRNDHLRVSCDPHAPAKVAAGPPPPFVRRGRLHPFSRRARGIILTEFNCSVSRHCTRT